MKKKTCAYVLILLFLSSVIVAIVSLSLSKNNTKNTVYTIDANLKENTLIINQNIDYVNDTNMPLNSIRLVAYVEAFSIDGDIQKEYNRQNSITDENYAKFEILSIAVNGKKSLYNKVDNMYYDVILGKELSKGKRISINIQYRETIPRNNLRYGYNDTSINIGNAFIRVVPSCCDKGVKYPYTSNGDPFYDDIADFNVQLTCDDSLRVTSTGRLKVNKTTDNCKTYSIEAKNVRDFALVLSDNMHIVQDRFKDIDIYYMTSDINNTYRISLVKNVLKIFEELYFEYPYSSISIVENEFQEGGMEYPMLVYVNKNLDSATTEKVIIHELAHQWWYGIIGNNENVDYFIDEGMAEFSTYLYYLYSNEVDYANALMKMAKDDYLNYRVHGGKVEKMNIPLENIGNYEYYVMAYLKAPLVMHKIMSDMGRDVFLKQLKVVACNSRYKIIDIDKFISYFGNYKGEMRSYIDGKPLY